MPYTNYLIAAPLTKLIYWENPRIFGEWGYAAHQLQQDQPEGKSVGLDIHDTVQSPVVDNTTGVLTRFGAKNTPTLKVDYLRYQNPFQVLHHQNICQQSTGLHKPKYGNYIWPFLSEKHITRLNFQFSNIELISGISRTHVWI